MLELLGVEVLALEFVEEDGRVTTRVTVVVLLGFELGVVVAELEVRAGDEVVVTGRLLVVGVVVVVGRLLVVGVVAGRLSVLLSFVVGVAVVGRSGLSKEVLGVLAAEERETVVLLPALPVLPPDTE